MTAPIRSRARASRLRGFTLVETMVVVGIAGVLSSVAYPSLEGHVLRARRTDALVALMQAQLAEERYRASHDRYGSLAEAGLGSSSASGHYALQVAQRDADGFELLASARGRQERDAACRHLRLASSGSSLVFTSGPEASTANSAATNRSCWNQ